MPFCSRCRHVRVLQRQRVAPLTPTYNFQSFPPHSLIHSWSVTLVKFLAGNYWGQSGGGKEKEKPVLLLHFTSCKVPDKRALCVTVIDCTDLELKRWFFFRYCIKLRKPFHLCSVRDNLPHRIYSFSSDYEKKLVNSDDSTLLCLTRSHITDWKGVDFLRLFETAEQLMCRKQGSVRLQLIHQVLRKPTATAFLGWRWVKHEMWHLPRCWVLTDGRSAGQVYLTLKVSCDALQRWKVLISCYVSLQAFFFFF